MSQTLQVTGELIDPQMVKLDQPIALTSGKVRVTVELLPGEKGSNLCEFMERMWEHNVSVATFREPRNRSTPTSMPSAIAGILEHAHLPRCFADHPSPTPSPLRWHF